MYNVKLFKYPSGWQYRIYDNLVGIKDYDSFDNDNTAIVPYYDNSIGDYIEVPMDMCKMWENPFSGKLEKAPLEFREFNAELSAKHSFNRTINQVYHIARSNIWDWFVTLTFNPEKVDSFDYDSCVKALSYWLKNLRKKNPNMKYLVVPEKHKSGRFHFHGLFASCENIRFLDSGHVTKKGEVIYNIGDYKKGFSTATLVFDNSRVTKYLSKYITKDLCSVSRGKKRYWASRNLEDAETITIILDADGLNALIEQLDGICKYKKHCAGLVGTTYFEL